MGPTDHSSPSVSPAPRLPAPVVSPAQPLLAPAFSLSVLMEAEASNTPEGSQPSQIPLIEEADEIQDISEEEELEAQTGSHSIVMGKERKNSKLRSKVWEDYIVIDWEEGDPPIKKKKGKCKRCGTDIQASSKSNGTSALRKHTLGARKDSKHGQVNKS
ncbi:hypothetical protein OROHE_006118 [Orobanche hederae]